MKIHIPNSAFLGNIETFISDFNPHDDTVLEISANPKWTSIHPLVVSMIVSLAIEVKRKGGKIVCPEITARSKPYLKRIGLTDYIEADGTYEIEEHESSGKFIKATVIKTSTELNRFITDMVPLLHTSPEQADPIKYVISELVRNALEHSWAKDGAVITAQYFPKSNRVSIGVADRGVGILNALEKTWKPANDASAMDLALTPGITGITKKLGGSPDNGGFGLFFTKSIAKISRQFFLIYSGKSMFKLLKTKEDKKPVLFARPTDDRSTRKVNLPHWEGTAVGLDISLSKDENFQGLLNAIYAVYKLDKKEKKKEKYKKPIFK